MREITVSTLSGLTALMLPHMRGSTFHRRAPTGWPASTRMRGITVRRNVADASCRLPACARIHRSSSTPALMSVSTHARGSTRICIHYLGVTSTACAGIYQSLPTPKSSTPHARIRGRVLALTHNASTPHARILLREGRGASFGSTACADPPGSDRFAKVEKRYRMRGDPPPPGASIHIHVCMREITVWVDVWVP